MRISSGMAAVAVAAVCLGGCASGQKPRTDQGVYEGPGIRVDSAATTTHILVMEAPQSGYSFAFDRLVEERERVLVFVTVEAPNPAMVYTQALVEQRLGTGVPVGTPLAVYARFSPYGGAAQAYRHAAQSDNYK